MIFKSNRSELRNVVIKGPGAFSKPGGPLCKPKRDKAGFMGLGPVCNELSGIPMESKGVETTFAARYVAQDLKDDFHPGSYRLCHIHSE